MTSPAIDTTYVFGRLRAATSIRPVAPDPRLAPDAPRTLCAGCGRPVATHADDRGLPEYEGAWLCWEGDHGAGLRRAG